MRVAQGYQQRARLATFMLGHFSVDLMSGLLPALYPLLALELRLDYREIGALALAYTAAVSLTQPLFGYLADRWGVRQLAPLSLAWSGLLLGLYGFVHHPTLLYLVAFLAGLGSGAYHPVGASRAAQLAPERHRNTTMSIYTVSGTVGYALGPLVGVLLFRTFGSAGTLAALPLGLVAAGLVRWGLGRFTEVTLTSQRSHRPASQRTDWRALAPILAIVMLRSWTFMTVATFAPVWYREMGYEFLYGVVATIIVASGAVGTLLGGILADRIGAWRVLLGSLTLAVPALLSFAASGGPLGLIAAAAFGLLADASISITLVAAQRLLPGRTGVASGFILGMGFVTGGIGAPVTGWIADRIGLQLALASTATALLIALTLCWVVPTQIFRRPALASTTSKRMTATSR